MSRRADWRSGAAGPFSFMGGDLARLLEDYLRTGAYPGHGPVPTDLDPRSWQPPVDVYESADALVVLADVPGVDPSTIDLSVTANVLTLKGNKVPSGLPESELQTRERRTGVFHRELVLPSDVDFDRAHAQANNGVLMIHLPKRVSSRPRTIPIHPVSG